MTLLITIAPNCPNDGKQLKWGFDQSKKDVQCTGGNFTGKTVECDCGFKAWERRRIKR